MFKGHQSNIGGEGRSLFKSMGHEPRVRAIGNFPDPWKRSRRSLVMRQGVRDWQGLGTLAGISRTSG